LLLLYGHLGDSLQLRIVIGSNGAVTEEHLTEPQRLEETTVSCRETHRLSFSLIS
jgi:hypothetical protein